MSRQERRSARHEAGFTLIELMLAVSLLSLVVVLTLDSLGRQQKTSIVTEQVVETQQNTRAVASLIEREIRMAGFMVPDSAGVCGVDSTSAADELYLSETEMIVPDDERSGTLGARFAAGVVYDDSVSTAKTYALDSTTTDLDGDGAFFYDNDGNGTPEADFSVAGGYIVGDLANPHRGTACGIVDDASATQLIVRHQAGGLVAITASDAPAELVIVPAARYWVDGSVTTGRFMRNGDMLAQGVDDFQVSYYYDLVEDGVVAAAGAEEPGSAAGAAYDPEGLDGSVLREVRFFLVLRTRTTDPEFEDGQPLFFPLANRPEPATVPTDGFRRRVVVGAVRPRNIGQSGSI